MDDEPDMSSTSPEPEVAPETLERDIERLELDGREYILVGTAHISQESVDTVEWVIDKEDPDVVCVELDAQRFESLRSDDRWEDLDLVEVIKQGKLTFLLARLALTAFQKQMGSKTGINPGAEMLAATEAAERKGVPVELVDRNVQTTLLRAWRLTPWYRRAEVALVLIGSLFQSESVDESDLSDLRDSDMIATVLDELGEVLPEVKRVLVDERDLYMAHSLQRVSGDRIVAIVGAAHRDGIADWLPREIERNQVDEVTTVPEKSTFSDLLPWILPCLVVGVFVYGFFRADPETVRNAFLAWVLANGILSSLGTIAARGHPLTVIAAFVAAPLTSLNPTIGAGMATAFVQTLVAAPKVRDFQSIDEDLTEWTGWWSNRLARIMLVFLFSSIGSTIGTFVAFGWLKNLLY
jgi:pheromone shutdown-related protein TraB